jgi:hypothetical protein
MPFLIDTFSSLRPFLYHATARENLRSIAQGRSLLSASKLIEACGSAISRNDRRTECVALGSDANKIWLQTQKPLYEKNILFEEGWNLDRLLNRLNDLVFFWPGDESGPAAYGRRHFAGNLWPTTAVMLRIPARQLFNENPVPLFCPYNSGSPRHSKGMASPRGPRTFLPCDQFERTSSGVVEVVMEGSAHLPNSTEVLRLSGNSWELLYCSWELLY